MRKLKFRNILLVVLISVFALSAIFCCCLTGSVQAEEPVPSCHKTSEDTQASHNSQECNCDQSAVIVDGGFAFTKVFPQIEAIHSNQNQIDQTSQVFYTASYFVPPQFYDASPLYIQYSVFRI